MVECLSNKIYPGNIHSHIIGCHSCCFGNEFRRCQQLCQHQFHHTDTLHIKGMNGSFGKGLAQQPCYSHCTSLSGHPHPHDPGGDYRALPIGSTKDNGELSKRGLSAENNFDRMTEALHALKEQNKQLMEERQVLVRSYQTNIQELTGQLTVAETSINHYRETFASYQLQISKKIKELEDSFTKHEQDCNEQYQHTLNFQREASQTLEGDECGRCRAFPNVIQTANEIQKHKCKRRICSLQEALNMIKQTTLPMSMEDALYVDKDNSFDGQFNVVCSKSSAGKGERHKTDYPHNGRRDVNILRQINRSLPNSAKNVLPAILTKVSSPANLHITDNDDVTSKDVESQTDLQDSFAQVDNLNHSSRSLPILSTANKTTGPMSDRSSKSFCRLEKSHSLVEPLKSVVTGSNEDAVSKQVIKPKSSTSTSLPSPTTHPSPTKSPEDCNNNKKSTEGSPIRKIAKPKAPAKMQSLHDRNHALKIQIQALQATVKQEPPRPVSDSGISSINTNPSPSRKSLLDRSTTDPNMIKNISSKNQKQNQYAESEVVPIDDLIKAHARRVKKEKKRQIIYSNTH